MAESSQGETRANEPLELYLVRVSPPCRIVWLYLLQHNIPHEIIDVDLNKATSDLPGPIKDLPHLEVPILLDGDLVIFEAPAILEYLARTYTGHLGFGHGQQSRLLTESLISWANGELHRSVGYNFVYPQFLDRYALTDQAANEELIEAGLKRVSHHLETLEKRYLDRQPYLCGQRVTLADSFVATVLLQLEWPGLSLKLWPKVHTWISRVKHVDFWDKVHQAHTDYVAELRQNRYRFE